VEAPIPADPTPMSADKTNQRVVLMMDAAQAMDDTNPL